MVGLSHGREASEIHQSTQEMLKHKCSCTGFKVKQSCLEGKKHNFLKGCYSRELQAGIYGHLKTTLERELRNGRIISIKYLLMTNIRVDCLTGDLQTLKEMLDHKDGLPLSE